MLYYDREGGISSRERSLNMILDPTLLLILIPLLLGMLAQSRVQAAYEKYSKVRTRLGVPASMAVRQLLDQGGAGQVTVARIAGSLTDHFDPATDTLRLSEGVYDSASVAALGIAAHEAGHALQKQEHYPFLALRTLMVPTVNIGSRLAWPIFLLGLVLSFRPLQTAGIALFAAVVFFSLITLPVEIDASRRARKLLAEGGYLTNEEEKGVQEVLTAAAMTYVVSFISALMQWLRLVLLSRRRD